MPLRAKIADNMGSKMVRCLRRLSAWLTRIEYSTYKVEDNVWPLPEDDPDDVMFSSIYGLRTIELNRPNKLNSLNGSMARKVVARLLVRLKLAIEHGLRA